MPLKLEYESVVKQTGGGDLKYRLGAALRACFNLFLTAFSWRMI